MSRVDGSPEVTLRPMAAADRAEVDRFLRAQFPPQAHQHRSGWLDWQLARPDGVRVLLCTSGADLVGLSVFLPVALNTAGGVRRGAFSTSTMIAPTFRRRGIGRRIHEARLGAYDFALSGDQSAASRSLYRKMGFRALSRFRAILVNRRLPRPYPRKRFLRELLAWTASLPLRAMPERGLRVAIEARPPERVAPELFEERMPAGTVTPMHTDAYLAWRYGAHPYFDYRFAHVARADGRRLGFGVFRLDGATCHLVDVYCRHPDLADVLRCLGRRLPGTRIEGFFAPAPALAAGFRQAGWYTYRRGRCYFAATLDDHLRAELDRPWCAFGGDSDTDR